MAKTPKAVALGSALRQARQDKGLKLRDFALHISRDPAMLSRWENGERSPKPEQAARILALLGVTGQRYDEVMSLVYGTSEPHWVATTLPERRQQMAAYMDYEQKATSIVEVAPLLIPGLLQTPDYIRSIMSVGGTVPEAEIPSRVADRLARQAALTRNRPAQLLALIGQAALSQPLGGPAVMAHQLRHLLEMAQLPNVDLRVVPFGTVWNPSIEGAFALMESDHSASSVFIETRKTMLWLHQHEDVKEYKRAVNLVVGAAMSRAESMVHIAKLVKRMEQVDAPDKMA
ncbi:helix-turn-helix transcriptional regulator [Actinokineospora sp. UTMC 2448]|uniref:helix-turn-helix domain-containing protein n=1 Tax=Actinokineospora sp. UTMC 2448 TaxID=2268449 RepID=UPI002164381C|nr:helix-turn-helix transcriptional regulator [Actinokineospora sp. UTMC 2448]UVS76964.1 Helix-turn-helix domain protein [Actinokineospora sp. UTMC 2448]